MIKFQKLYVSVFTIALIPFLIFFKAEKYAAISYFSLVCHEIFHLFFAYKLKIKVKRIVVLPFGINIKTQEDMTFMSEILFCSAGPLANLIIAAVLFYLKTNGICFFLSDYIILSNISIFLINILPIYPLDGGRIFKRVAEEKNGHFKAAEICILTSQVFVFLVCIFIFLTILMSKFNLSIMVLCCFLIYSLSEQKKSSLLTFSQLLIYSSQKLENTNRLPVREIVVNKTALIKDVIKMISESVYVMVTITDKKGKIIARISETELIKKAVEGKKYIYESI